MTQDWDNDFGPYARYLMEKRKARARKGDGSDGEMTMNELLIKLQDKVTPQKVAEILKLFPSRKRRNCLIDGVALLEAVNDGSFDL